MGWIFSGMIVVSFVFAALNGRMEQLSMAALDECSKAVQLVITLTGSLCLWSGMMKIADKAKLTEKLAGIFSPVLRFLFKGLDPKSGAGKAITMNITANLLGLGNAATPLGITAMRELDRQGGGKHIATNHMVTFVVLNTASLQLLPTTTAVLRLNAGSAAPLEILPAVWLTSIVTVISVITMSRILGAGRGGRR